MRAVPPSPGRARFANFAWFVLAYNLAVIVWGAFVRASFSGDGCGSHWPLCDGALIPPYFDSKTLIEFSHRMMSALDGLLVLGLAIWAYRLFAKGSPVRKAALVSLLFIVFEALIGRGLVKFGWVAHDASSARAVVLAVHLANTFVLIGALALCAAWSAGIPRPKFKGQGAMGWAIAAAIVGLLAIGISGAVTALGDTLYPLSDAHATVADISDPTKHFLVRLRILHPLLALVVGLLLTLVAGLAMKLRPSANTRTAALWVIGIFGSQLGLGLLNVVLKAPIPMQMAHLLLADVSWVALIVLAAGALAEGVERVEWVPQSEAEGARAGERATWRAYVALTKPRVISLLLFTTITAMFAAAGGWPGLWPLVGVLVGGYMSAGAANTINMVLERDLDALMRRTSTRPTITHQIPAPKALTFGLGLAAASFAILGLASNLMAAMLSLAGLVFYVIVYTMMLKRRTWQNIVIGGAAGAFPPLVGWAAVTGSLSPLAWTLFGIVFLWTPVHFWALALLIKDDYHSAGVPMLPVVHGERATVLQIVGYAVLTAALTVLPWFLGQVGSLYLWTAIALDVLLLVRSMQLYVDPARPRAVSLYKYSMLYLAILFLTIAVDQARIV
ncbi:MAG: heme o synthase [Fimbriimonadaceae bacterium]|nr:heme o synthase [Fimbriimonadaceae bacterium]